MYIEDGSKSDYLCNDLQCFLDSFAHASILEEKYGEEDNDYVAYVIKSPPLSNIYMWGWIGDEIPDNKNWKPNDEMKSIFLNAILKIEDADLTVDHFDGWHTCEICEKFNFESSIKIEFEGLIFCCPNGVSHYILEHNYKPNDKVIQAVLNGKVLSQQDLTIMGKSLYMKEIEEAIKNKKKQIEEEKKEIERQERVRKEYFNSLSDRQRELIKKSLDGSLDVIPM